MLVEREEHLAILLDAAAATDGPAVRLVSAPAGGGKSVLLAAAAAEARERGWTVLSAGGSPDQAEVPLAGLVELLESGPVSDAVVDAARDGLADVLSGRLPDACAATALFVGRVHKELAELAAGGPVLLTLDDAPAIDAATLHVVAGVLRRRPSGPIVVVATARPGTALAVDPFLTELVRFVDYRRVEIAMLSRCGVRTLLGDALGADPSERLVEDVHVASGGNPLLVHALIADSRAISDDHGDPDQVPVGVGATFRAAVAALLSGLGGAERRAAEAAAVLGERVAADDVVLLTGLSEEDAATALGALRAGGLLVGDADAASFGGAAVRACVLARMDAAARLELREAAAHLLYDRGAGVIDVATHLLAAGRAREPWAVKVLLDAAQQAESIDRVDVAVEALQLAVQSDDDRARAARSLLAQTRLEWRNEPSAAARHLPALVAAAHRGELDAAGTVLVARWSLWLGQREQGHDLLAAVLADPATPVDDAPAIRAELVALRTWFPEDVSESDATTLGEVRRLAAPLLADARMNATIAAHALARGARPEDVLARAEQVLADCELSDASLPTIMSAARTLILADQHERADSWIEMFLREAGERKAATWEALLATLRAEAALRRGDLPAAHRWSERALATLSRRSWGVLIGLPYAVCIEALVAMSRVDDALALARHVVPSEMYETRYGLRYLQARGRLYLAADRLHAARADFARCEELVQRWGIEALDQQMWRVGFAGVYLRLNQAREARSLVTDLLAAPPAQQQPRARGEFLRVAAATSDARRRPAILREAVDLLQEAGGRVELSMALAELSRAYTGLGEFNRARLMSRRALEVALECGAEASCRRVLGKDEGVDAHELPNAAEYDEAADLLSDAERRVAELAVMGHTNREISAKLFITVSTVEQHLTRVYRKLGVRKRVDLPLRLRGPLDSELTLAASA